MTDKPAIPPGWDYSRTWYHGSPLALEVLLPGSTITQDEHLARVFSHKPSIVSIEDDPAQLAQGVLRLRHTGTQPGLLYQIDEPLTSADVYPHPRTSMPPGLEWLTTRPVRVRLLGPVEIVPEEYMSEAEVAELIARRKS